LVDQRLNFFCWVLQNAWIHQRTQPPSIQKSAVKNDSENCVAANSKIDSDGGVVSSFTLFFVGCLQKDPLEVLIGPIRRSRKKKLKDAFNGLIQVYGSM